MKQKIVALSAIIIALVSSVLPAAAADDSAKMISELNRALSQYEPYRIEFDVIFGGEAMSGFYEVDGGEYYISLDNQELYGDEAVKCEVYNSRKEIVIDLVAPDQNGNILTNPATAFTSIRDNYDSRISDEHSEQGRAVVELLPKGGNSDESITLELSTQTMLPEVVNYKFGSESIEIRVRKISKLTSTITQYNEDNYLDYEIIDFR